MIMKIVLTTHARERMKQRGVSLASVRRALTKPLVRKPSYRPTEVVRRREGRKTLEVVFRQEQETYIVITAYYL